MSDRKRAVYVPLSVHYSRDAAIAAAGEAAELLFLRGLAYCKGTDDTGFIPDYEIPVVAVRLGRVQQRVDALVEHDLWLKVPGGYQVRSWNVWNDDATAQRKRDQAAVRQQAKRDRQKVERDDSVTVTRDDRDGHAPNLTELNATQVPTTSAHLAVVTEQTAGTLMAEHLEHCAERPPGRVVGQTSRLVKELLGEGIPADQVRAGLSSLRAKSLNPSTLPSLVNEARNPARRRSTTDDRVAAGAELIAKYADLEGLR